MERKVAAFINKGMSRDLAISKASNEFAFDNQNIRITPDKESTLLSVSNEKGTYKVPEIKINGTVIGYCVCNERLLVFSTFRKHQDSNPEYPDDGNTYSPDYLTLIYNKTEKSGVRLVGEILYEGDLGLSMDCPVETLFNYETETVQKVYWVDGVHQVRFVNISADKETREKWKREETPFDLLKELKLQETITISKTDFYGEFPAGVMQYFITYSNYFGQESPVIWQSGLIYLNLPERGLSKEEFSNTAVRLELSNLDTDWDRVNIYSIIRTELNSTPQGRRQTFDIRESTMTIVDTGLVYETADPSEIFLKGGDLVIPGTMTAKDNVLFVGNNKIERLAVSEDLKNIVLRESRLTSVPITIDVEDFYNGFYSYRNYDFIRNTAAEVYSDGIFYPNETYHFGVQFQNKLGLWTEPVYIGEYTISSYPIFRNRAYQYYTVALRMAESLIVNLTARGFRKMRMMVAEKHTIDSIQGLVFPTVFKVQSRNDNTAFAQTSWFARPYTVKPPDDNISEDVTMGVDIENRHNVAVPEYGASFYAKNSQERNLINKTDFRKILRAEVQSNYGSTSLFHPYITAPSQSLRNRFVQNNSNSFFIDHNIVDMFSPDIDENSTLDGYNFRIIGIAEIYANMGYKAISATNVTTVDSGINQYSVMVNQANLRGNYSKYWNRLSSGTFWNSKNFSISGNSYSRNTDGKSYAYLIFPWHKTGSIVNDPNGNADLLTYNRTSNLQYCGISHYASGRSNVWESSNGSVVELFKETENLPIIIDGQDSDGRILYKGNIDELLSPRILGNGAADQHQGEAAEYPIFAADTLSGSPSLNSLMPANCIGTGDPDYLDPETMWNPLNSAIQAVRMQYKSTPHAVVKFCNTQNKTYVLPYLNDGSIPGNHVFKGAGTYEFWKDYDTTPINPPIGALEVNIVDEVGWILCSSDARKWYAEQTGTDINSSVVKQLIAINADLLPRTVLKQNTAEGIHNGETFVFLKKSSDYNWDDYMSVMQFGLFNSEGHQTGMLSAERYLEGLLLKLVDIQYEGQPYTWAYGSGTSEGPWKPISEGNNYNLFEVVTPGAATGIPYYILDVNDPSIGYRLKVSDSFWYNESCWDWQEGGNLDSIYAVRYSLELDSDISSTEFVQDRITLADSPVSGFFIGELYKKQTDVFDEAASVFYPCSESSDILPIGPNCKGDCWFNRIDLLRVYAASEEAENSVIDIVSARLVTRKNPNARYDRNRGMENNTTVSPLNFNLYNNVYNQKDNFYVAQILNPKVFQNSEFKTSVIWSLPKNAGAETDNWTRLYASNILYLDGDKGELRSLNRLGNSIISFQDKSIAEIIFNPYAQIPTSQGIPVELANSGRVEGKRYLYNNAGCMNKWSIIERDNSIYFIDDISGSINALTPQLVSLSDTKGFKTWINQTASQNIWNPLDYKNVRGFYDKSLNDVYWSSGDYCLVYSELLGQFMSFMPYRSTPMIENFNGHLVSEKGGELWYLQEGDYNSFYGQQENYSIEYRVTPDPYGDKIFTNIEYRSDMFDGDTEVPFITYDRLDVFNEYQSGSSKLKTRPRATIANLKKRLRIWRADIPRDTKDKTANPYGLNRMRNPWISLRLTKDNSNGNHLRNIFHDLVVYYYE